MRSSPPSYVILLATKDTLASPYVSSSLFLSLIPHFMFCCIQGYAPRLHTAEPEAIFHITSSSSPPRILQPPSSSLPLSSSMTVAHQSRERDEVIPTELCHIAGNQRYTRKLPPVRVFSSSTLFLTSCFAVSRVTRRVCALWSLKQFYMLLAAPPQPQRTHLP
jgi:hypothetical protein